MKGAALELRWFDDDGVSVRDLTELTALRSRTDGFLWLDIPTWTDEAEELLSTAFGFHPMALADSRNRNHVPKVHAHPRPRVHRHPRSRDRRRRPRALPGARPVPGQGFLVTVHGPHNPAVPLEVALRETAAVAQRIDTGRLAEKSPFGLTYAIVSLIARREAAMVAELAREVGLLEQRVMLAPNENEDPQAFLSELFTARHELLTIKTMAAQGGETYRRAIQLTTFAPAAGMKQ